MSKILENLKREKINSKINKISKIQTKTVTSDPRNGKKKLTKNKINFIVNVVASKPIMKIAILK